MFATQVDFFSVKSVRSLHDHVAAFHVDVGTNALKAFQVKVYGAVTDNTAAR